MNIAAHRVFGRREYAGWNGIQEGFGNTLEATRMLRDVSLGQAAAALDISALHLAALEQERFEEFIYPLFAVRAARAYLGYLRLPERPMMTALFAALAKHAEENVRRRAAARAR